jgi:hypothetical protein
MELSPIPIRAFEEIERHAIAAASSEPAAVQDLCALLWRRLWPISVASSLRSRLLVAELRFRGGTSRGVSDQQLADALTELFRSAGLSEFENISASNLGGYRRFLSRQLPHVVLKDFGGQIAPIEAAIVTMLMLSLQQWLFKTGLTHGPSMCRSKTAPQICRRCCCRAASSFAPARRYEHWRAHWEKSGRR